MILSIELPNIHYIFCIPQFFMERFVQSRVPKVREERVREDLDQKTPQIKKRTLHLGAQPDRGRV